MNNYEEYWVGNVNVKTRELIKNEDLQKEIENEVQGLCIERNITGKIKKFFTYIDIFGKSKTVCHIFTLDGVNEVYKGMYVVKEGS